MFFWGIPFIDRRRSRAGLPALPPLLQHGFERLLPPRLDQKSHGDVVIRREKSIPISQSNEFPFLLFFSQESLIDLL